MSCSIWCQYASIGIVVYVVASAMGVLSQFMSMSFICAIEMSKANNWQYLGTYVRKHNSIGQDSTTSFDKKSHVCTPLDVWEYRHYYNSKIF